MGTVTKKQLTELFSRVDAQLREHMNLYLIGGASAILGYNVAKETNDVDVDGGFSSELEEVFDREAKALKLDLHLSAKGVFSPPDGYRERVKCEDFPKKKLRVWYLDQYDLAISKIDRGIEKDFEDIMRVHKKAPYDLDRLIQIFNDEYIQVAAIGNPKEKKMNLVDLATNLFGDQVKGETIKKVRL